MQFRIDIHNVQPIKRFSLELDLSKNMITCLVGRNGVGKTTLVRAMKNLSQSDTFVRTAPTGIFSPDSAVVYSFEGEQVTFNYDRHIGSLNCKEPVSPRLKALCAVELPIPHGDRFNFFQSISRVDRHIRRQIILEEYNYPKELVEFLSDIYSTDKFQSLVETRIGERSYFSILLDNGGYVREDYLSSGEYFLVSLYRTIRGSSRLIVVDEIDISLDAAAQVQLLKKLREFCAKYSCNVLFTTHSLAMMRTLHDRELVYMEQRGVNTTPVPVSYSYVKSRLFGFSGWDRYILTEDRVLRDFINTLIRRGCPRVFFTYKIIYIGGGWHVVDLLVRNRTDQFLSERKNVIAVLDGDQKKMDWAQKENVYFLPFESVEKALHKYYMESDFPHRLATRKGPIHAKDLFESLQRDCGISAEMINEYIYDKNDEDLEVLRGVLSRFLSDQ